MLVRQHIKVSTSTIQGSHHPSHFLTKFFDFWGKLSFIRSSQMGPHATTHTSQLILLFRRWFKQGQFLSSIPLYHLADRNLNLYWTHTDYFRSLRYFKTLLFKYLLNFIPVLDHHTPTYIDLQSCMAFFFYLFRFACFGFEHCIRYRLCSIS